MKQAAVVAGLCRRPPGLEALAVSVLGVTRSQATGEYGIVRFVVHGTD